MVLAAQILGAALVLAGGGAGAGLLTWSLVGYARKARKTSYQGRRRRPAQPKTRRHSRTPSPGHATDTAANRKEPLQ